MRIQDPCGTGSWEEGGFVWKDFVEVIDNGMTEFRGKGSCRVWVSRQKRLRAREKHM